MNNVEHVQLDFNNLGSRALCPLLFINVHLP